MTPELPGSPLDEEIAKEQARSRELAPRHRELSEKIQAQESRAAYYQHLVQKNNRMEREIAAMEGRPYYDPDDPYAERPDPPDPPDA